VDRHYYLILKLLSNRVLQALSGSSLMAQRGQLLKGGKYLKGRTSVL
jgi:hypothetical protein